MASKTPTPRRASTAAVPDPTPPQRSLGTKIRVRATRIGYFDHIRRREGDVFTIRNEPAFSDKWMERVDPRTPEVITTSKEDLRRKHDEILHDKAPGGIHTDAEPDAQDNPLSAE